MRTIRTLFFFLVTLQLAAPALAQQAGILIGLAGEATDENSSLDDFSEIHEPQYQTLWIAPNANGELKVLASLPELIVPRQDGFWHVGVKQVCEFEHSELDPPNERLSQTAWAAPVMEPGVVEQSQPCTAHKPEDYAPPLPRSEEDKDKISRCGVELVNILYVSPEVISISDYSLLSAECNWGRGGGDSLDYLVGPFESYKNLGFGELLGPKAHDAYIKALPQEGEDDAGNKCGESIPTDDTGWRIAHKLGNWRPYLHQNLGHFGCAVDAPVHVQLPASITKDAAVRLDWKLLRSKIVGIMDAYVSPSADMLLAVTRSSLRLYELRGGVPGKLLIKLPASKIVMVQWATGTHVNEWSTQIAKLANHPPPAPVIRVKPESNK